MKQVIICNKKLKQLFPNDKSIKTLSIEGVPVNCALVEKHDKVFDSTAPENKHRVLVKKRAFSCNYRDKAIMLEMAMRCDEDAGEKVNLSAIGSDFIAEVTEVGPGVHTLRAGDRVIGNANYPSTRTEINAIPKKLGFKAGVPTNTASSELDIFHFKQLLKVPNELSDEAAAAFTIGAITCYSMIRKLDIQENDTILITAAKSNTSLFVINALRKLKATKKIKIFALSSSKKFAGKLKAMGVDKILIADVKQPFLFNKADLNWLKVRRVKFDCVIDPFFDLYFSKIVYFMAFGGRYISCGVQDQHSGIIGEPPRLKDKGIELSDAISMVMMHNIRIIGNCLGVTSDLDEAMADYTAGKFNVEIDSVFTGGRVFEFINRTYNAKTRFGKVVYKFSD